MVEDNLDFSLLCNVEQHEKVKDLTAPTEIIVLNDQGKLMDNDLNQSAVWVTFQRFLCKSVTEYVAIETGKQLSDKHINFTQCMIKNQFSSVGGLQSTMQQVTKVKGQKLQTASKLYIVK